VGCFKDGYDVCFNEKQLREVNKLRLIHKETNLVALDKDAAKWLHTQLNDAAYSSWANFRDNTVGADTKYKAC